jgi:hypothetical protein
VGHDVAHSPIRQKERNFVWEVVDEDHYVPIRQLTAQLPTLTSARSVTARVFAREEQAQNHCQVGNIARSVRVMLDGLDGLYKRDGQFNHDARPGHARGASPL